MITIKDYLMDRAELNELSPSYRANLHKLLPKINELLKRFGEDRKCNSGFRTQEDQKRINPKAMGSQHCQAAAIDLEDRNGKLYDFLKSNEAILNELDLYCEERMGGWQHLQLFAPKSNKRWFFP